MKLAICAPCCSVIPWNFARSMIEWFENPKYCRSRPSCVWQSVQCAFKICVLLSGEAWRLCVRQRVSPAAMSAASLLGGVHAEGSSTGKKLGSSRSVPVPSARLSPSTR